MPMVTSAPLPLPPQPKTSVPPVTGVPPLATGPVRPGWTGPPPPQPSRQPPQITQPPPPRGPQHPMPPAPAFQQPAMMPAHMPPQVPPPSSHIPVSVSLLNRIFWCYVKLLIYFYFNTGSLRAATGCPKFEQYHGILKTVTHFRV